MPYINVSVSKNLGEADKDAIKQEMGKLITVVPGKSEGVLMVQIEDNRTTYFGGEKKDNAAYVDIRLLGSVSQDVRRELMSQSFEVLGRLVGVSEADMFVTVSEHGNWGYRGGMI